MNIRKKRYNYRVILSVTLLSTFLWFMARMNKSYDYAQDIPLRVINNNPEYCLKYEVPEKVRVEFVGKGKDLLRLNFYDIVYELDLSDVKERITLSLTDHPEYVRFPEEVSVEVKSIIRPQLLIFEMDRCQKKRVPVKVAFSLTTAPGYTLVDVDPEPDSVLVQGPASFVDTLSQLITEKKVFQDVQMAFSENFSFKKYSPFSVRFNPERVNVFFDVQRLAEKEIDNVPVKVINVPPNLDVVPLPSFVKIYVKGGEKILANATRNDFTVYIDYQRDWKPGMRQIPATIKTELNVLYMESRPSKFELIIQKKRNKE